LGVWEFNIKAIRFYHRYGFEAFSTHEFMLGDEKQTDVLMKRKL
jgi:ribosomal protein S18 acetylase RimI-like enzyme